MLSSGKEASEIVPVVGLFAATAFRVLPSINKIVGSKQQLKVSRAAIEAIYLDLHLPSRNLSLGPVSQLAFENIEVDSLVFSYDGIENPVLSGVNLRVKSGEAVGFVGQSGSGKSTLIDIMLGLLDPKSGSVKVNGRDIGSVKQSWQQQVGYIPQTIFLMDDSLRRNIAIGIADNEIVEVAIVDAL
jgi:ABC-type multidrug transport system fused ATPase/permease subunit